MMRDRTSTDSSVSTNEEFDLDNLDIDDKYSAFSTETYPDDDLDPNKMKLSTILIEPKIQGSSFISTKKRTKIELLPNLESVHSEINESLLIQKLKLCCVMFDFNNPTEDLNGKEIKRNTLKELSDFTFNSYYNYLTPNVYPDFFKMFRDNLFRAFPQIDENDIELEDEECYYEVTWPHLLSVYEILENVISSGYLDVTLASETMNDDFFAQLIELFDTRDKRERSLLTSTLHTVYSKFFEKRPLMREYMGNIFYRHIYEDCYFHGIAPLLDIYSSIVHGFSVPIKHEHIVYLKRFILPLHTGRFVHLYHQPLQICVVFFIIKDETLAYDILDYLTKKFPKTPSQSRILILTEIEKIFSTLNQSAALECLEKVFNFISKLIRDPHYQISERSILFTKYMLTTSKQIFNAATLCKISLAVQAAAKSHWNKNVVSCAYFLLELISKQDAQSGNPERPLLF